MSHISTHLYNAAGVRAHSLYDRNMTKIPQLMQAAFINNYGTNDEVQIGRVDVPEVGQDDVLIKVRAASVNPLDIRIRDGKMKQILAYKMPLILGNDLAGVVVKVGTNVKNFKLGDEIYARADTMRQGSFAEYIAVRSSNVSLKPKNLSMEDAAALPLVALTAWQILVVKANIKKGQKVLIHGGSGGVGSTAIQLAKHLGAHVATTASENDRSHLQRYGVDEIIDYKTRDFSSVVSDYDLVLDTRGGETLKKSLNVLKPGGQVISINGTPDAVMADELGLGLVMKIIFIVMSLKTNMLAKKLGVKYSFHFMQPNGAELAKLKSLYDKKILKPVVDKIFSLDSAKDALAYLESGKAKGKIVISV